MKTDEQLKAEGFYKNGKDKKGNQSWYNPKTHKSYTQNFTSKRVSEETKQLALHQRLNGATLSAIAKNIGVTRTSVLRYYRQYGKQLVANHELGVDETTKTEPCTRIECDEVFSFELSKKKADFI